MMYNDLINVLLLFDNALLIFYFLSNCVPLNCKQEKINSLITLAYIFLVQELNINFKHITRQS